MGSVGVEVCGEWCVGVEVCGMVCGECGSGGVWGVEVCGEWGW